MSDTTSAPNGASAPAQAGSNGASAPAQTKSAPKSASKSAPKKRAPKPTLARQAQTVKASKRRPVFVDVPGIPRVPLSDGRTGAVQCELILSADGTIAQGAHMLAIPRSNGDGTEGAQWRIPLADVQLVADGFKAAGLTLV